MTVLFEVLPQLLGRVPWTSLGVWPTPVESGERVREEGQLAGELWLKRDDLSSPIYGGNKLRLLEHLLGAAREAGDQQVYASGAVGSNFAVATALHAPRVGLEPGAICFPQPLTAEGEAAHRVVQARARVVEVAHWSLLPLAAERARRRERVRVLSQVSFEPENLLGYLAGGLELAQQVSRKLCPAPARIVLPIGSAATSAGLLAGLSLARKIGLWSATPNLIPVRIASWPLSRRGRVLSLAERLLLRLSELCGDSSLRLSRRELLPVTLISDQLGAGYPYPTAQGEAARAAFARAGYPILDGTYSAKAAAHALQSLPHAPGPVLFWCTKSSAPLPDVSAPP